MPISRGDNSGRRAVQEQLKLLIQLAKAIARPVSGQLSDRTNGNVKAGRNLCAEPMNLCAVEILPNICHASYSGAFSGSKTLYAIRIIGPGTSRRSDGCFIYGNYLQFANRDPAPDRLYAGRPRWLAGDPEKVIPGVERRGTSRKQHAHRSISPNTMSSAPMIAGTSARVWPVHMKSNASRWA